MWVDPILRVTACDVNRCDEPWACCGVSAHCAGMGVGSYGRRVGRRRGYGELAVVVGEGDSREEGDDPEECQQARNVGSWAHLVQGNRRYAAGPEAASSRVRQDRSHEARSSFRVSRRSGLPGSGVRLRPCTKCAHDPLFHACSQAHAPSDSRGLNTAAVAGVAGCGVRQLSMCARYVRCVWSAHRYCRAAAVGAGASITGSGTSPHRRACSRSVLDTVWHHSPPGERVRSGFGRTPSPGHSRC